MYYLVILIKPSSRLIIFYYIENIIRHALGSHRPRFREILWRFLLKSVGRVQVWSRSVELKDSLRECLRTFVMIPGR